MLGSDFVWTLFDATKCDLLARADSRLFHPAAEVGSFFQQNKWWTKLFRAFTLCALAKTNFFALRNFFVQRNFLFLLLLKIFNDCNRQFLPYLQNFPNGEFWTMITSERVCLVSKEKIKFNNRINCFSIAGFIGQRVGPPVFAGESLSSSSQGGLEFEEEVRLFSWKRNKFSTNAKTNRAIWNWRW